MAAGPAACGGQRDQGQEAMAALSRNSESGKQQNPEPAADRRSKWPKRLPNLQNSKQIVA
jgi:hypothetical protein